MRGIFFIATLLLIISCQKNEDKGTRDLTSQWKETDHYFSIGGPIQWHPTEPQNSETIEFRKDSVFYSSVNTKLNGYRIEPIAGSNSAILKLFEQGKTDTTLWYISDLSQNSLTIGVSGCIEGCGKKFVRVERN